MSIEHTVRVGFYFKIQKCPMDHKHKSTFVYCPNNHEINTTNKTKFCPECGSKLIVEETTEIETTLNGWNDMVDKVRLDKVYTDFFYKANSEYYTYDDFFCEVCDEYYTRNEDFSILIFNKKLDYISITADSSDDGEIFELDEDTMEQIRHQKKDIEESSFYRFLCDIFPKVEVKFGVLKWDS